CRLVRASSLRSLVGAWLAAYQFRPMTNQKVSKLYERSAPDRKKTIERGMSSLYSRSSIKPGASTVNAPKRTLFPSSPKITSARPIRSPCLKTATAFFAHCRAHQRCQDKVACGVLWNIRGDNREAL